MEWRNARRSENVQDLRGRTGRGIRVGGGLGAGGLLLLLLITYLAGGDPLALLTQTAPDGARPPTDVRGAPPPPADEAGDFVSVVLASTEDVWAQLFARQLDRRYQAARLALFDEVAESACGTGTAAVGPFYCPGDGTIYIDLSFYRALDRRFGAPGDFAQAYVIAHEVGHHVQNLLGIDDRVRALQQRGTQAQANQLSVLMELQADCLAGVWGHHVAAASGTTGVRLEDGDVEEGLRAAAAIGDDTIQRRTQGRVMPESWTHGSSEQRVTWLRRGLRSGQVDGCDTFGS